MGAPTYSGQESTENMMKAYINYLPSLLSTTANNIGQLEAAETDIRAETAPRNAAIDLNLLKVFGPEMAKVGSEIEAQNNAAQMAAETANLAKYGSGLVSQAKSFEDQMSPEWAAAKSLMGSKLTQGLNQLDMSGGLSGGEIEAINRQLAQENAAQGLVNTPTSLRTVRNAMMFGDATRKRQQENLAAVNQAAPTMASMKSNVDPFMIASRRPSNLGDTRLNTAWAPSNSSTNFANSFMNQTAANARTDTGIRAQQDAASSPMALAQGVTGMITSFYK